MSEDIPLKKEEEEEKKPLKMYLNLGEASICVANSKNSRELPKDTK